MSLTEHLLVGQSLDSGFPARHFAAFGADRNEKAVLSGICIMAIDSNRMIKGAVINEFGVKAFNFIYNERKHKVRLIDIMPMLDKWYIRHILRRDLRKIIPQLITRGSCEYTDLKYGIDYIFKPLEQEHNAISE